MSAEKPVDFIQNVLSTIILDAIQFFPQNKKAVNSECHGLLFGVSKDTHMECDFAFPVGSVENRDSKSVLPDEKVDLAVMTARKLFSTSECIGTYHSHPYDEYFRDWSLPSNSDCASANYLNLPYFFIIGIARNGKEDKPLAIEFLESDGYEFTYNPKAKGIEFPEYKSSDHHASMIEGHFQKYQFTIEAYKNTGESLINVDLFSSEGELIKLLNEEGIDFTSMDSVYNLRKLEYNLRQGNWDKTEDNIRYHVSKLRDRIR